MVDVVLNEQVLLVLLEVVQPRLGSLVSCFLLLLFLFLGLGLGVDEELALPEDFSELVFGHLEVSAIPVHGLFAENCAQQDLVLEEDLVVVLVVYLDEDGVRGDSLVDVDVSVLEHVLESVLEDATRCLVVLIL